jgi:hypothetical protein
LDEREIAEMSQRLLSPKLSKRHLPHFGADAFTYWKETFKAFSKSARASAFFFRMTLMSSEATNSFT